MYHVNRWGPNKRIVAHYYCLNCMHSAQDVLNEIDSDEIPFGIAGIDDFWHYSKKDNTRMEIRMQKLIESTQKNKNKKSLLNSISLQAIINWSDYGAGMRKNTYAL